MFSPSQKGRKMLSQTVGAICLLRGYLAGPARIVTVELDTVSIECFICKHPILKEASVSLWGVGWGVGEDRPPVTPEL